jgi:hypothetical protein
LRLRLGVSPLPDEEGEQKGGIPSLFLSLSFFWFFFTPLLVLGCILLVVLLSIPCMDPHFIALYGLFPLLFICIFQRKSDLFKSGLRACPSRTQSAKGHSMKSSKVTTRLHSQSALVEPCFPVCCWAEKRTKGRKRGRLGECYETLQKC